MSTTFMDVWKCYIIELGELCEATSSTKQQLELSAICSVTGNNHRCLLVSARTPAVEANCVRRCSRFWGNYYWYKYFKFLSYTITQSLRDVSSVVQINNSARYFKHKSTFRGIFTSPKGKNQSLDYRLVKTA